MKELLTALLRGLVTIVSREKWTPINIAGETLRNSGRCMGFIDPFTIKKYNSMKFLSLRSQISYGKRRGRSLKQKPFVLLWKWVAEWLFTHPMPTSLWLFCQKSCVKIINSLGCVGLHFALLWRQTNEAIYKSL